MQSVDLSSIGASEAPRTAVVTGANGFVGARAARALCARGWRVRAVSRKPPQSSAAGMTFACVSHLDDADAWDRVLPGSEAVVHCAGLAHVGEAAAARRRDEFMRVNVEGTIQLASAALRHGLRRLVFVSSIGVNGSHTDGRPFREADSPNPKGVYAESKLRAEKALVELTRGTDLEIVIVRPCLVVGPGAPGNLERLVSLLRRGLWLPFGAIANRRSLISVDALAELLAIAAEHPAAPGRVFLAAQGQPVSTPAIIAALARGAGVEPRLVGLPIPALRLIGTLVGRRADIDRLCDSLEVDASAARDLLGWVCTTPILRELERVAATHRDA